MPALCVLALAVLALSGGLVASILMAARREQARYAAACRSLLPSVRTLQDHVRDLLSLLRQAGGSVTTERPALRQARERLTAAGNRLARSADFETLRSSEAGDILERLDVMLGDLSASAWVCLSAPPGSRAHLDALSGLTAATLRLCGQVERRLRAGLTHGSDEAAARAPRAPQPARATMRWLSAHLHRPSSAAPGRGMGFGRLPLRALPRPPAPQRAKTRAHP